MQAEDLVQRRAGHAWRHFLTLLSIPHPSGQEAAVRTWLLDRAAAS